MCLNITSERQERARFMIGSVLIYDGKYFKLIYYMRKRVFVHHYSYGIDIIVTLLGSVNKNS